MYNNSTLEPSGKVCETSWSQLNNEASGCELTDGRCVKLAGSKIIFFQNKACSLIKNGISTDYSNIFLSFHIFLSCLFCSYNTIFLAITNKVK